MEENLVDSYAVLYKKEIENEDEQTFLFKPCYVVKGIFDIEEGIFLDEVNKARFPFYDSRIIEDTSDFVVGTYYTLEDIKTVYPLESDAEIRMELFKEADAVITMGKYDPKADVIVIQDNDRSEMTSDYDTINNVLNGNISYDYNKFDNGFSMNEYDEDEDEEDDYGLVKEIDKEGMKYYETAKKDLGLDFLLFTDNDLDNLLTYTNFEDIKNYIDYIKNTKDTYIYKLNYLKPNESGKVVIEGYLYSLLETGDIDVVKEYLKQARECENTYDPGAKCLDYNDLLNTVRGVFGRITYNEECDVRGELKNLREYYDEYLSALIAFREIGYDYFKAMTYTYLGTQVLNKVLKENDENKLKQKFIRYYNLTYDNLSELADEFQEVGTRMEENVKKELKQENRKRINQAIDETNEKLNELVGLKNVKDTFNSMFANILFNKETEDNLVFDEDTKHMVFTGNPGTGKTTVAEVIAPFLHKVGYLDSDKVAFVAAQDLVGEYVGQTAPKTQKVIDKNKGGIIIVDEAYILSGSGQSFGNEAITVMLKEMEKNRTMFIFAGYEKEMKSFLKMNSGIKSRVGTYLHFNDYTEEELFEIFERIVKKTTKDENQKYKLTLTKEAKEKVKEIIHDAKEIKDFGNGRFVKNLFNVIRKEHAMNTREITDIEELYLITEKDIPDNVMEKVFFNDKDNDSLYKNTSMGFGKKLVK